MTQHGTAKQSETERTLDKKRMGSSCNLKPSVNCFELFALRSACFEELNIPEKSTERNEAQASEDSNVNPQSVASLTPKKVGKFLTKCNLIFTSF